MAEERYDEQELESAVADVEDAEVELIGWRDGFAWQWDHRSYFLSRILFAVQNLINGRVVASIGPEAVAAGPFTSALYTTTLGFARGALTPVGQLVKEKKAQQQQNEIGNVIWHGWITGFLYGIVVIVAYLFSPWIARTLGLSESIAEQTGAYLRPFVFGVWPILFATADFYALLSLGESRLILFAGIAYSLAAMGVGYPLALGWLGLPKLGLSGLMWGGVAAAVINLVMLRLVMTLSERFAPYQLYRFSTAQTGQLLWYQFYNGVPVGLQKIVDWLSLAVLAWLIAYLDPDIGTAASAPISYFILFYNVLWGQTFNLVSMMYVAGTAAFQDSGPHMRNARQMSHASGVISFLTSLVLVVGLILLNKPICQFFLNDEAEDYDSILSTSRWMLVAGSLSFLLEPFRSVYAAGLQGLRDVWPAPGASFFAITVFGLAAGALLSYALPGGTEWMYVARLAGIAIATGIVFYRFMGQTRASHGMSDGCDVGLCPSVLQSHEVSSDGCSDLVASCIIPTRMPKAAAGMVMDMSV